MHRTIRFPRLAGSLLVLASLASAAPAAAQSLDTAAYGRLHYRFIGPEGNRAIAVVGEPGNPLVAYVGAASGGLFKTEDGGANWRPVFDDQDVSSVSALAIDPQHPSTVWAGTGETFIIRPALSVGNGIYRSTDAGRTWQRMGLEKTGRIGRIDVDPQHPNVVFACALGHAYGPQQERGVYRTKDGGETWQRVLFVDEGTGCADLDVDPNDPSTIFAGMWSLQVDPWKLASGGTGGGVYVSHDGGDTWKKLSGHGLPAAGDSIGKVAVRVAPSNSQRVYALLERHDPELYRSDDGGGSWRLVSRNHDMAERASYYTRFNVDPGDPDRLYFVSVKFGISRDGGETMESGFSAGGDNHDIWIDPTNADRYMVASDGGATITLNRGDSFQRVVLPIAQMYHVHTDNQVPYNVYGNRQDGESYMGPSNGRQGFIPEGMWHSVGGCESGFAIPDTAGDNEVWSGCYDGGLEVYDPRTEQKRNVRVWPEAGYGWPPADLKERWHWTFPIAISPFHAGKVYVGSQRVHVTTDGGSSWKVISPDLTLNDKSKQQSSGGMTTDNLQTFDGSVLYALAESPAREGVLWAGTNDGQISVSQDGGANWTNVTANLKGVGPYGTISNIEPSRWDAGTAYVALDRHQMADFDPHIFKTTDYGKTWKAVNGDIPSSVFSFVHVVREDPHRKGMLWAGTENAAWFSLDDGAHWHRIRNDMPPAPVYWLTVQPHFNDLVVGTYGRGFWILDDITPIRALTPEITASASHLFEPRQAYRFQPIHSMSSAPNSNVTGRDPRYGADINYWLGDSTRTVKVEIMEGDSVIRTLDAPKQAGLNRTWWDLRYEPSTRPKLRTTPPQKPWVAMRDDGSRPVVTWDLDLVGGQIGPLAPPGTYTVRLTAGDRVETQPLTVVKDPHSTGTLADIRQQVQAGLALRNDISHTAEMINRLEWTRKQLGDVQGMLAGDSSATDLVDAAKALEQKIVGVEGQLFDVHLTGAREDAFRNPMKLYGRLSALASDVFANGADFAPTQQQSDVKGVLEERLQKAAEEYRTLLQQDVPALQQKLQQRNVPAIISLSSTSRLR